MGRNEGSRLWALRRKLFRRPRDSGDSVFVVHNNEAVHVESEEELAAITIQACSRGHLARRAYRALRSLVKLQALARGVGVRRQARLALDCMHALARLHVAVRARRILFVHT